MYLVRSHISTFLKQQTFGILQRLAQTRFLPRSGLDGEIRGLRNSLYPWKKTAQQRIVEKAIDTSYFAFCGHSEFGQSDTLPTPWIRKPRETGSLRKKGLQEVSIIREDVQKRYLDRTRVSSKNGNGTWQTKSYLEDWHDVANKVVPGGLARPGKKYNYKNNNHYLVWKNYRILFLSNKASENY